MFLWHRSRSRPRPCRRAASAPAARPSGCLPNLKISSRLRGKCQQYMVAWGHGASAWTRPPLQPSNSPFLARKKRASWIALGLLQPSAGSLADGPNRARRAGREGAREGRVWPGGKAVERPPRALMISAHSAQLLCSRAPRAARLPVIVLIAPTRSRPAMSMNMSIHMSTHYVHVYTRVCTHVCTHVCRHICTHVYT